MNEKSNIFINKKILIYGIGKSGFSSFKFLKGKNEVFLFDDNKKLNLISNYKKNTISFNHLSSFYHLNLKDKTTDVIQYPENAASIDVSPNKPLLIYPPS